MATTLSNTLFLRLRCAVGLLLVMFLAGCSSSNSDDDDLPPLIPIIGLNFPVFLFDTAGVFTEGFVASLGSDGTDGINPAEVARINVYGSAAGQSSPLEQLEFSVNDTVQFTDTTLPLESWSFTAADGDNSIDRSLARNEVSVTVSDAARSATAAFSLATGSSWMAERGVQVDSTVGRRVFTIDAARRALLQWDTDTGVKTVVPESTTAVPFAVPEDMVIDSDGASSRALVVDRQLLALLAVELDAGASFGDRSVISDAATPNANEMWVRPVAVEINAARDTAYVLDEARRAIIAVVLSGGTVGERSVFWQSADARSRPVDMVYQPSEDRFLVADAGANRIIAIDNLGAESDFSSAGSHLGGPVDPMDMMSPLEALGCDTLFLRLSRLALADDGVGDEDTLYAFDRDRNAIIAVDASATASDGVRRYFSGLGVNNAGIFVFDEVDPDIPGDDPDGLFQVDQEDSRYCEVVSSSDPDVNNSGRAVSRFFPEDDESNFFRQPAAMAFDATNEQLLVVDNALGVMIEVATADGVDRVTGQRNFVAGGASANGDSDTDDATTIVGTERAVPAYTPLLEQPGSTAFFDNALAPTLYTIDARLNSIVGISLLTGVRGATPAIAATGASTSEDFQQPDVLLLDQVSETSRFLVFDSARGKVIESTTLGVRRELLDNDVPAMDDPVDAVLYEDADGDVVGFVLNAGSREIIQMTFGTEIINAGMPDEEEVPNVERAAFATLPVGATAASAMIFNSDETALLVVDNAQQKIYQVVIDTAVVTEVGDFSAKGADSQVVDIALDSRDAGGVDLLMLDRGRAAVFPVALTGFAVGADYTARGVPNTANVFVSPVAMVWREDRERLFVLDDAIGSLYIVDLNEREGTVDAQRLVMSRGVALNGD